MVCNKFVNHKPKGNRINKKIESKTGISFTLDWLNWNLFYACGFFFRSKSGQINDSSNLHKKNLDNNNETSEVNIKTREAS